MHDEVIVSWPEQIQTARWDSEQNRWRHYLQRRNAEGLYEDAYETDEIGIPLEEGADG